MTVLPGSLDYLYYNGILPYIPYEAYESVPCHNNITGTLYLNQARQGLGLNTQYNDTFVKRNPNNVNEYSFLKSAYGINNGIGDKYDFERTANGNDGKNIRTNITNSISNASPLVKGLASAGILAATLVLLCKGHGEKAAKHVQKSGFWSKLNPTTWFKKK